MDKGEVLFSTGDLICISFERLIPYLSAASAMSDTVSAIICKKSPGNLWFLEHEEIITAGSSAKKEDLLSTSDILVLDSDRGGQYTYHGPGQLISYIMLDLKYIYGTINIRRFIEDVSQWLVCSLTELGVECKARFDDIGIWSKDKKIASIAFKVRKFVTYHGISINISNSLSRFKQIRPCGLDHEQITSLLELGYHIEIEDLKNILLKNFLMTFAIKA